MKEGEGEGEGEGEVEEEKNITVSQCHRGSSGKFNPRDKTKIS